MTSTPSPKRWRWKAAGVLLLSLVVGTGLVFRGCMAIFFSDENQAAGESIAAALEAFGKEQGRFPERLRELQPKYLATIPKAGKTFGIVYAAAPGGTQCWLAYQVHRDSFQEYDCRQRTWLLTDYEETHAVKHPRVEWIRPSGRD